MDFFKNNKLISEIGGGLGDMGILVPITTLLIISNGLSPVTVFCFLGLHYLITGYYFNIPLPVQPLKAAAMVAIATGATPQVIAATGIIMGIILLLMTIGSFAHRLGTIFTKPIVRGIQLAVGLFLINKGVELILNPPDVYQQINSGKLSLILAAISGGLILFFSYYKKLPATLIIIPAGILFGLFMMPTEFPEASLTLALPEVVWPSMNDFVTALVLLVIPQIPLTFANAVVSTHYIAKDYYGDKAKRVTPRALCTSLGIGNLAGGLFGAMPCCHGAGGLTAHYSFGARTGFSTIFLGLILLLAGIGFGDSVYKLFSLIPAAILGTLLIYVGIKHCVMIKDVLPHRQAAFITLLIGAVSAGTHNIAAGFAIGMAAGFLIKYIPAINSAGNKKA